MGRGTWLLVPLLCLALCASVDAQLVLLAKNITFNYQEAAYGPPVEPMLGVLVSLEVSDPDNAECAPIPALAKGLLT